MGKAVVAAAGLLAVCWIPVAADDLRGHDRLLCAGIQATVCTEDGHCEIGLPSDWNIPQFVEIDLTAKSVSTTAASGRLRMSPFRTVERQEGRLFLQGIEQGRAYGFVIDEASGRLSAGVTRDGVTVSVFGACTPATAAAEGKGDGR